MFRTEPTGIEPLVVFRVLFGTLMAVGAIRFMANGWIERLYGEPVLFFYYPGFSWIPVPDVSGMYLLYTVIALSAVAIAFGWHYRVSTIIFFITFSWSELSDLTNYLNHYWLVIFLAFLLIWLPAHRAFSIDVRRNPNLAVSHVPRWCIDILKIQIGLVYFFAGLAKLNADWLFHAMPLAIWLPEKTGIPILGLVFGLKWTPHILSWGGAMYDLSIPFLLLFRRTRSMAYLGVIGFHLLTHVLFNIGQFPAIMITTTLIFFSPEWHQRLLSFFKYNPKNHNYIYKPNVRFSFISLALSFWILVQVFMPLRHLAYPGNVLWNEHGYRFSWRVMLVEKNGWIRFTVIDRATGRKAEVINSTYLTDFQEKQMAIQPDLIVQFAQFLGQTYRENYAFTDPIVRADSHVALNGRVSRRFINPDADLNHPTSHWTGPYRWVIPWDNSDRP